MQTQSSDEGIRSPLGEARAPSGLPPAVHAAVEGLLASFARPEGLEKIARHVIPSPHVPCARWSLLNRLLVELSGSSDVRGFRQWETVGRHVRRGARAVRILAPRIVRETRKRKDEHGVEAEQEVSVLRGWMTVCVFRAEDTVGKPLAYGPMEPPTPPPLIEVARRWGLEVRYGPFLGSAYGSFSDQRREIRLQSWDPGIFLHELAHAAESRVMKLRPGQEPLQEIVAEFSSAVLRVVYGFPGRGNALEYIESYASDLGIGPVASCLKVLPRVERVLRLILEAEPGRGEASHGS